ncbi:MAG: glycosyltransferase [Halioglobus sp.]
MSTDLIEFAKPINSLKDWEITTSIFMKILHFILGKANKDRANGVNQVIAGLSKYSGRLGAEVRVIGKTDTVSYEGEVIVRDGFSVRVYSRWSRPLRSALVEGIRWADVIHLHGVYSPFNLAVANICLKMGRPYIITLHDGLAPERERESGRVKKIIYHRAIQRRHLEQASGVHVLTNEEATDLFSVASPKNVFCIPNGVDIEDYPLNSVSLPPESSELTLGFLGRISPEKNLDVLCSAFSRLETSENVVLKLAGPNSSYGDELSRKFDSSRIEFVGPKYGQDKYDFVRSLDLFVHPSLCDVFSIAAMEVLALGTPLLITRTSKVAYFYDRGAFFMCEPTLLGIEVGLLTAIENQDEWPNMTSQGCNLIESRLNWDAAATDMLKEYEMIVANYQ